MTYKEFQEKCNHNYALRCDTWLKWRCCGCGVMNWKWEWRKIKKKQINKL